MESITDLLNKSCQWHGRNKIVDYSGLELEAHNGSIFLPELKDLVCKSQDSESSETNFATRVRGTGHSTNLRSIPRLNDLLVVTRKLNRIEFCEEGFIDCQAGVQVGVLQSYLQGLGWFLPVTHSGDHIGPSVGGFFIAGGFGEASKTYGGFWDNVEKITWFDFHQARLNDYDRSHHTFWKLSGSGGREYGLLVSLRLKILKTTASASYPFGTSDVLPWAYSQLNVPHIIWQTAFLPNDMRNKFYKDLRKGINDFAKSWVNIAIRSVEINSVSNKRPVFMNHLPANLIAVSIGGELKEPIKDSAFLATQTFHNITANNHLIVPYDSCEMSPASFSENNLA